MDGIVAYKQPIIPLLLLIQPPRCEKHLGAIWNFNSVPLPYTLNEKLIQFAHKLRGKYIN